MKVQLLTHTPNPEKIIACAAKLCYSASSLDSLYDSISEDGAKKFVDMLSKLGHESPIEHISFTFGIEGVSRALLAQITRHRIASFSVQSQRYVNESEFSFVTPPNIEGDPEASALFKESMERDLSDYCKLTDILKKNHIKRLLAEGFDEKEAEKTAEKSAIEDARFVLPNACATKMILTMNARSLLHFFELRCCNRAQWEIRKLATEMLKLVLPVAPTLFSGAGPSCVRGGCKEGKMSCRKSDEVRKYYQYLSKEFLGV